MRLSIFSPKMLHARVKNSLFSNKFIRIDDFYSTFTIQTVEDSGIRPNSPNTANKNSTFCLTINNNSAILIMCEMIR